MGLFFCARSDWKGRDRLILQGICAALLAASLTPLVIVICRRLGIMDIPRDYRRMHCKSVPRGGGIAVFLSFGTMGLAVCPSSHLFRCALVGGLGLFLLGLIDDIRCLGPLSKLWVQILLATGAVLASGMARGWRFPVAVLWVLLLTNAHNFIDGMDGLLMGSAAIEGGGIFLVCSLVGLVEVGVAPLLLSGACLGFLCFNRYPASVFSGDCGSLSVGFLLGFFSLPLLFGLEGRFSVLSPLFLFAYPLTDLLCAVLRRVLRGKSPFYPDRGHLHHRICDAGISHPLCVGILHSLAGASAMIGVLVCQPSSFATAGFFCLLTALLLIRLRFFISQFG